MNLTNIDWCQFTWNPITGCLHDCGYCYARGLTRRFPRAFPNGFKPTFHPERLGEPAKEDNASHIFVGSMTDMFGSWVEPEWIKKTFNAMSEAQQHTYTILTKAPWNLPWSDTDDPGLPFIPNLQIGTSITGCLDHDEVSRLCALDAKVPVECRTVVSIEPYTTKMDPKEFESYFAYKFHWLIIGGLTGARKFQPPAEWIDPIIDYAHNRGIPVFVKHNAGYAGAPQEYPEGVPHGEVS